MVAYKVMSFVMFSFSTCIVISEKHPQEESFIDAVSIKSAT